MDFKTFFFAKSMPERDLFADRVRTTRKHLTNIAYGYRTAAPELAVLIETESGMEVTRQELLPNTWQTVWPPKEIEHGQQGHSTAPLQKAKPKYAQAKKPTPALQEG